MKIALEFRHLSSYVYVDSYQLATIYAGLSEKDEAFHLLEKATKNAQAACRFLRLIRFGLVACVPIHALLTCCAGWGCRSEDGGHKVYRANQRNPKIWANEFIRLRALRRKPF